MYVMALLPPKPTTQISNILLNEFEEERVNLFIPTEWLLGTQPSGKRGKSFVPHNLGDSSHGITTTCILVMVIL